MTERLTLFTRSPKLFHCNFLLDLTPKHKRTHAHTAHVESFKYFSVDKKAHADIFVCSLTQFLEVSLLRNVAFKRRQMKTKLHSDVTVF